MRPADRKLREALGGRVKRRREALKLTQARLGEKVGMDESAIRAVEAGRRGLSLETLVSMSKALKCGTGELVGDEVRFGYAESEITAIVRELDEEWQAIVLETLRSVRNRMRSRQPGPGRG